MRNKLFCASCLIFQYSVLLLDNIINEETINGLIDNIKHPKYCIVYIGYMVIFILYWLYLY